jgi:hypothetical protein
MSDYDSDDFTYRPDHDRFEFVDHCHDWDRYRCEPQHCEPRYEHVDHCTPQHYWH